MACETLNLWTFSGLVGAFLDLGVAYLLLCASSLAFLASKFLGLFGLYLPCPCDCSFLKAKGIRCWKRALVDHSSEKVTSVQSSVKGKYPFDLLWDRDPSFRSCFQFTGERNHEVSHVELEGEGSSNVIYERRARRLVDRDALEIQEPDFEMECPRVREEERCDFKAKGIENKSRRKILRRRHKVVFGDDNVESVLSNDVLRLDVSDVPQPFTGSRLSGNKDDNESFFSVYSADGKEVNSDKERAENDEYSAEDLTYNLQGQFDCDGTEKNSIRRLKEALEEERKARNALHLELEKERSAAASAADEAMAMILRLQEEKASVEMEARQYRRTVEEKNVFDTEEMNILKEMLLRREMELHFLEKEVEAYRLTMFENDDDDVIVDINLEDSTLERQTVSSSPLREDSMSISREIRKSNGEKHGEDILTLQVDKLNESNAEERPLLNVSDETNFKERGMVIVPENSVVSTKVELSSVDLHNKSAQRVAEESILNSTNQEHELNPARSVINTISLFHDVHVIDENAGEVLPMDGSPSLCRSKTEREIMRSSWDLTSVLPTKVRSSEQRLVSDLRRNSMSAVDCERLKIGNEVGLLMERLKVIQEGREKLNFPIEHKETETNLERHQSTALRTAQRRASSPPRTSKVIPKKRGCRSSSLSIPRST